MTPGGEADPGRRREDLRQFVAFGFGYAAVLGLGYLLLREINLTLSTVELGRFSYVSGLVGIVMPILYVAAPQAYLRFHDRHAVSSALRRALWPLFAVSALGTGVIAAWKTHSALALAYAAFPFFNERLFVFRAQMRTGAVNALKAVELAVPFVGVLVLSRFRAVDAATVLALYGAGYLLAFAFPLRLQGTASPDRRTLGRFLVPVTVTTLVAALIENLTVVMTKSLMGYEAAAEMGVAARNLIFIKALFSFLQMFYPVVYFREMAAGHRRTVRCYRAFVLAVALVFSGALIVGAPILYRLTGAAAYLGSTRVFMVLAAAFALDFVFETYALYFQHEIRTWKATAVKAIFLVVLGVGYAFLRFAAPMPRESCLMAVAWLVFGASAATALVGVGWAVTAERRAAA